jgi:hypothetical protein
MNYKYLLLILAVWFTSCKQLEIKRINKVETIKSIFYNNQIIAKGNIIDMEEKGISDYGFCYAANNEFPTINNDRISLGTNNKTGEFSANLIGLQAFNVYYFRAYAISNNVVTYGNVFSTEVFPNSLNIISLDSLNIVNSKQINLTGSINGIGGLKLLDFGYYYSFVSNPSILSNKNGFGTLQKDTVFNAKILNPIIDTTYYVKAFAQLSNSAYFSSTEKTVRVNSLKISTTSVYLDGNNKISMLGYFNNLGADPIQEYGFCYSTTNALPTYNDSKIVLNNPKIGSFSATINLTNEKYFVRVYAIVEAKIIYGQVQSKSF